VKANAWVAHILASKEKQYLTQKLDLNRPLTPELRDSIARAKIQRVKAELESGRSFEDVAKEFSDDSASAENGGLINFPISEGDSAYSFESFGFKEPIDSIYGPVETTYGYHMVKVLDRTPEHYYELDSAREASIRTQIESSKGRRLAAEFFDSLMNAVDIRYNEAFSAGEDSLLTETDWAIIIDSTDTIPMYIFHEYSEREKQRRQTDHINARIKNELLYQMANLWTLAYEAKKRGYHQSQEYEESREDFLFREKYTLILADRNADSLEPSEAEMREYYENNLDQFTNEKMISIQQVVVEDRALAEQLKERVNNGEKFQIAAMDYAQGETEDIKRMTINLGWITPEEISKGFFDEVYSYPIDSVTQPIKTKWGWHVVKLLGKTGIQRFEDVRVKIRRSMIDTRRQAAQTAWEKMVLEGLEVKIDYNLLKEFPFTPEWLPVPDIEKMMRGF
jgi:parvulin-like peptidyl-prolyl isomerase